MLQRIRVPHERIGVAVSGGADSVFLLHALVELGVAAAVLHVNHGLRGAESDADEAFVRELGERLKLPVVIHAGPVTEGNVEQEARRIRYEFFTGAIAAGVCERVATGHTLDDQAETVLYRFLRGAGTAGLAGIRPATGTGVVRPLLELRRAEIRAWLQTRNIAWREDESNADPEFARNRIRHQIMPELTESMNPALADVLAATAHRARDEEDYWTGEVDRLEPRYLIRGPETVLFQTGPFLELAPALQRRLLRRGIERVRGSLRSIDFRHVEGVRVLMEAWEGSGRIQLPGLDVYRSFDWLRLSPLFFDARIERNFEMPVSVPGITENDERGWAVRVELAADSRVYNDEMDGGLDWGACAGALVLRNWRPGDQYQAKGRSGTEKIKTLFQEFRIPLWERRSWPVIVQGDEILWTRGFGVASRFAAGPGSIKVATIREVRESNSAYPTSIVMKPLVHLKRTLYPNPGKPGAEVL